MIHVIAMITIKPGQREQVMDLFRANVPAVLAEEGCIEYGPAIDAEGAGPIQTPVGPDTFVVIEKWTTLEALAAHGKAAHMVAYAESVRDMLAMRSIHVLSPVE